MKNKNIIIIIAVVAVLIIGLIAYKVLSTPKNNIIDNTNTEEIDEDEDYSDDYPEELIFLTDTNKEITLSGEKVKVKIVTTNNNSYIYVNDKKVNYEYEYDNVQLYVTNDYAFVTWIGSQCNYYLINAIDKDGNLLEIEEKNIRQTFENIHYENDKLYADVYECATAGGEHYGKFELVREGNTIKLK